MNDVIGDLIMSILKDAWEPRYASRAERMSGSEIRELLKLLEQPDVISFAGGIPDPTLFPQDAAREAGVSIMADPKLARVALQYAVSEGDPGLRAWIAGHMTGLGVPCDADNIMITSGSQQALDFLGRMLLSPGDTALVRWPTYLGALQAFNAYEPRYDRLDPIGENRDAAEYTAAATQIGQGEGVKFAYAVPDFANPTGATMSVEEREKVLALAKALDIAVIEDAAYTALRYEGDTVPSMMALDVARAGGIDGSRVIYCGTFSKTLSPGLRVGWICASRALISRLVLVKQASDLNSPPLNQMIIHRLAESVLDRQIAEARVQYRRRRDHMLAALQRTMPAGVTWTRPEGGLFIWVTFPEGIDTAALLERSIVEAKVAFVPGRAFHADGTGTNTARFSFSLANEEQIDTGIHGLARLIS
jgi:DNA-binding transcriptional MocR family regulator